MQPTQAATALPGIGRVGLDPTAAHKSFAARGPTTPSAIQWSPVGALAEAVPRPPEVEPLAPAADLIAAALASTQSDELRRRGSELLETLLTALAQGKTASASPYDDRVPLVHASAPAPAGTIAPASIRVTNEETTASVVSLYATNFVADSGYELPSLLLSISPRKATLPPGAEATFELKLTVPAQAPRGSYSGLVQVTGCKYIKAVVTFEVL